MICNRCWHWALPLTLKARDCDGFVVALRYEEWIIYHLHVVLHQRAAEPQ